MRAGLISLALGALAMVGAAPGSAQSVMPSRLSPKKAEAKLYNRMTPADRARMVMLDFAKCLLHDNRPGVSKAVLLFPDTPENEKQLENVMNDECLGSGRDNMGYEIRFSSQLARGAFYTALYLEQLGRTPPPLPAEPLDLTADIAGQDSDKAQNYVALRQFAECVIRAAPGESRAILLQRIGSPEEKAAYQALAPHLGACVPQGLTISFSKSVLGGLVAEVLYRLSTVTPTASATGTR